MRLREAGLPFALAAFVSSALAAQDAKKPPPTELTADVGLVAVSGNTSTSSFTANERYIRRIKPWEFKQDAGGVYGKTAGVESSNLLRLGLRADYDLSGVFALYGLTAYDRDRFAGIRSRFAEGAGGVWKIIATDINQFNVEAGYQYTQQKNLVGPDHDFSALRLASTVKHSFTKAAYVFEGVEYIPDIQDSQDYRVNSETDLVAPLSSHTAMKLSYVVRFNNQPPFAAAPPGGPPPARLEKTDQILSAGIQIAY